MPRLSQEDSSNPRIFCVLVLYRSAPGQSVALRTFLDTSGRSAPIPLLIYDNSPTPHPALPAAALEYVHDSANSGLAAAYNFALARARSTRATWLMLLDQDTELTPDYFARMFDAVRLAPPTAAIIAPRLSCDGIICSPHRINGFTDTPVDRTFAGSITTTATVFNSAAWFRVSALDRIGGFPNDFWLDYLDHAVAAELRRAGFTISVANVTLTHPHSIRHGLHELPFHRFVNLLSAERLYQLRYGTMQSRVLYRLRLAKRTLRLLRQPDKRYASATFRAALGARPIPPQGPRA